MRLSRFEFKIFTSLFKHYVILFRIEGCSDFEFYCGNGKCIKPDWECDRVDDCRNMADEEVCPGFMKKIASLQLNPYIF